MKRPTAVFIAIIFILGLGGNARPAETGYSDRILQTSSGQALGLGQILPDLKKASIIFTGEKHSDAGHHELQLRVIRTLHNLGVRIAVGLEMFVASDQPILNSWIRGSLLENQFVKAHEKNWGNTWELYQSIYYYTREKGIPLIGLNIPEKITNQIARKGFSSLPPEMKSELPLINCDISSDYLDFIRRALSVHNSPEKPREFENFCEAQLIWDTTMAFRLIRYLEENPGVTVVVITGNSHAWKPGIPEQLSRFSSDVDYRIILPEILPVQTRRNIDRSVADYLWLLQ